VDFARNLVSRVVAGFRSLAEGILGEIRTHLDDLRAGVSGIVREVFAAVRGAMSRLGGAIRGAISDILAGRPVMDTLMAPFRALFGGLFGGIGGRIQAIVERVKGVVDGAIGRLLTGATELATAVQSGVEALGAMIESGIDWIATESSRLLAWVSDLINELPGLLRDAISGIVDRVLGLIRRVLNSVLNAARAFVRRAVAAVTSFASGLTAFVQRAIDGVRGMINRAVDFVATGARAIASAVGRAKDWVLGRIAAGVSRILKGVLGPIAERLQQRVLALIGPAVGDAIRQAQLLFPNGMPAPTEIAAATTQAATQAASEGASGILQGLTNPEGDHLSLGISVGGSVGAAVGVGGSVSLTFDVVMDYRRNDIGFFVSPAAGGQVNLGEVGGTGNVSGVGSWGTVASFGDPNADVLGAYGGTFTNATYGVQAGLAVEGGLGVSTGGSFYRGGATQASIPLFSYTPLGADSHPVPGTGTAAQTTAATPDRPGTLPLGEVHFPRQVADVSAAPGSDAAIDAAVRAVSDYPTTHPTGQANGVDVLGEASRVWRNPGPGETRAQANANLATRRAESVAGALRSRLPGVPVTPHGNADHRAEAAGKPETDATPADQRASMVAKTTERGTPETTTPGTPPQQAPNQHDVNLALPNPFQARQAWGWDTNLGVTGYAGAEAKLGAYGGLGVSYSFPLGKTHLSADTMQAIRISVGFLKLTADAMTISPLGFIRDVLGLIAMSSEARGVESELANAVTSWAIETPAGAPA